MASFRARATGNWSALGTWSWWNGSAWVNAVAIPDAADDVWANSFTVTIDQNVTVLTLRNILTGAPGTGTASGGSYLISGTGFTVTCTATNGLIGSTGTTLLSVTGSGTNTLNANIVYTTNTGSVPLVLLNSTGVLNLVGNIYAGGIVGTIRIDNAITLNIVGNVRHNISASTTRVIQTNAVNYTINITGDVGFQTGGNTSSVIDIANIGNVNITGNLFGHNTLLQTPLSVTANAVINVIGNVTAGAFSGCIISTVNPYVKVVGICTASDALAAIGLTGATSILILSGNQICSPYGRLPFSAPRVFFAVGSTMQFEFASDSTNGAGSPAPAPTRYNLYSPDIIADAPIAANVRQGIVYALGSQTGTLIVPNPANVALNVPTDNTVGTAVLTPANVKAAVWDALLTDITTPNTIGVRLKNAATVDSTGDQIAALINT